MKAAIALFVLLAACSTTYECDECCERESRQLVYHFVDTDDDGLPDSRGQQHRNVEHYVFEDSDDDGLPDRRSRRIDTVRHIDTDRDGLPDARRPATANRDRDQRIERALRQLERAIAEVRAAMTEPPPRRQPR